MRSYKLLAVVAVATMLGCAGEKATAVDDSGNPGGNGIVAGTLQVSVKAPTLNLKNQTEFKVGYLVVEKGMAIIAMVPPCTPRQCNELAQGEGRAIAFKDIAGYTVASSEATVYWWKWVPGAKGLEVSGFTSTSVKLR